MICRLRLTNGRQSHGATAREKTDFLNLERSQKLAQIRVR